MSDLPLARRDQIAGRLSAGQAVIAAALATEFGVSEDAIRRDLRALAAEGRCRRVYGGALPIAGGMTPMAARIGRDRDRKLALARTAARNIARGEFLFLDSGSTNLALAEVLPEDFDLIVATNAIDIAAAVLHRQDLQLIVIGGSVHPAVGGCVDADALLQVQRLNIDRCFIGACALSAQAGLSAIDPADAAFKRTLLSRSRVSVAMVTNEKLETRAHHRVAAVKTIGQLVVEHDAPAARLALLKRAGVPIVTAAPPG
ncbi:Putative aga (GalNAc) operon transcriptional repressor agaR [Bradyrhizobium sp. ORS 285]|uniref:DeoR/GlpR family DNA-binding transcription regulator n=1 Tax=Bradyrhizobium sp. ORS 285 TaxID=115808 RepID=UPI00024094FE|nr:DeoR/GlpR family DNA-binding transcription regulator [Bradyrhizobium sp. ORS 285]CCD87499.1 putative aga (GalNAc) operon transcriptional repressor agaR [Bradyrhizobium sp. ORS 285]SMX60348.1 Putative aga (GalNAc) operon transcriptional repressor agaR [Bradyrhizobium sp. ORS 285]